MTLGELAALWTSGTLARDYPDHVRPKKSAGDDDLRIARYITPEVGAVKVVGFGLSHAEKVMRALPQDLGPATRRHVAQMIARLLKLAVYPLRVITASPIPPGWLPRLGPLKAFSFLYPQEDALLLGYVDLPLVYRLFYGFLAREGLRRSEALRLAWTDIDFERGVIILDLNKTGEPRAWVMDPGVTLGLRLWRTIQPPSSSGLVFDGVSASESAQRFREYLRRAGVHRAQLFERSSIRRPIRIHDLRATFVTLSLAAGKTETWVTDRTGHRSSVMLRRYQRAVRTVEQLDLGELRPLVDAIPELCAAKPPAAASQEMAPEDVEGIAWAIFELVQAHESARAIGAALRKMLAPGP